MKSTNERERGADANLGGEAQLPGVGKASLKAAAKRARTVGSAEEHLRRHRLDMSYDISFYFHQLRALIDDQTKAVTDRASATGLVTGDIVTFTGRLQPDPISAVLDIASPELAAEVARFVARRKRQQVTDDEFNVDELKASWENAEQTATTNADLARAVTTALHTDFRRSTTIEFHADVTEGLTGIVVCESEHFVTADPDRLLDGEFTVLGKVVASPEEDVPVLRKNKLLRRLNPQWVAWVFDQVGGSTGFIEDSPEYTSFLARFRLRDDDAEVQTDDAPPVDLNFPAIIEGTSFVVLPIAIYG